MRRASRRLGPALALLALLALAGGGTVARAQAGEPSLTLFEGPGYSGPSVTLRRDSVDLGDAAFAGRARSVRAEGRWLLCAEPGFRNCRRVEASEPDLGRLGLAGRVASVRRLDAPALAPDPVPGPDPAPAPAPARPLVRAQAQPPAPPAYAEVRTAPPPSAPAAGDYVATRTDAREAPVQALRPIRILPRSAYEGGRLNLSGGATPGEPPPPKPRPAPPSGPPIFFARPTVAGQDVTAAPFAPGGLFCRAAGLGRVLHAEQTVQPRPAVDVYGRPAGVAPVLRNVLCAPS